MSLMGYTGNTMSKVETRALKGGLARLNTRRALGLAEIEAVVALQESKIDGLFDVGRHGMQGAALLGQFGQQVCTAIPSSAHGVAFVHDQVMLGIGEVVIGTVRRLERI